MTASAATQIASEQQVVVMHDQPCGGVLFGESGRERGRRWVRVAEAMPSASPDLHRALASARFLGTAAAPAARGGQRCRPVGFYRSGGRSPALDRSDDILMQATFVDECGVFLVLDPPGRGRLSARVRFAGASALLPWRPVEFALALMRGPAGVATAGEDAAGSDEAAVLAGGRAGPEMRGAVSTRGRWVLLGALISGLVFVVARPEEGGKTPKTAVRQNPDPALALSVHRSGADLQVTWAGRAAELAGPAGAILTIRDGDRTQRVQLEAGLLRAGRVVYLPKTERVEFRLELPDGTAAAHATWVALTDPR